MSIDHVRQAIDGDIVLRRDDRSVEKLGTVSIVARMFFVWVCQTKKPVRGGTALRFLTGF